MEPQVTAQPQVAAPVALAPLRAVAQPVTVQPQEAEQAALVQPLQAVRAEAAAVGGGGECATRVGCKGGASPTSAT